MKRQSRREDGGKGWEKKRYTGAESEEREAFRALLPPSRSPSGTALFVLPSFARPRYTRVEETRRRRREERRDREGERRRFFFVLLDESGAGQARGEGRTGSRVEERQRAKEKARERERVREVEEEERPCEKERGGQRRLSRERTRRSETGTKRK